MGTNQIINALKAELPGLQKEYGVKRIGLFGSYARGTQTETSDVDVVAEFDRPIGLRFVEFSERIEQIVGHHVDVLTPAGISGIRNHRIAQSITGSVIYI